MDGLLSVILCFWVIRWRIVYFVSWIQTECSSSLLPSCPLCIAWLRAHQINLIFATSHYAWKLFFIINLCYRLLGLTAAHPSLSLTRATWLENWGLVTRVRIEKLSCVVINDRLSGRLCFMMKVRNATSTGHTFVLAWIASTYGAWFLNLVRIARGHGTYWFWELVPWRPMITTMYAWTSIV